MWYFILYLLLLTSLGGSLGYLVAKTLQLYAMAHTVRATQNFLWTVIAATTYMTWALGLLVRWF